MFKITHGSDLFTAKTFREAEKIYNRLKRRKYPCGAFTRMYCDFGDGYVLTKVGGKRIENALLPEHI